VAERLEQLEGRLLGLLLRNLRLPGACGHTHVRRRGAVHRVHHKADRVCHARSQLPSAVHGLDRQPQEDDQGARRHVADDVVRRVEAVQLSRGRLEAPLQLPHQLP
jgi:hypothetical protein